MFQLWKLAVLCGLLTGTLASLLGTLDKDLNGAVQSVKSVLDDGLQSVGNVLGSAQQTLMTDLKDIQNSKVLQQAKQKIQEVGNWVENGVSDLLSLEAQSLRLKVKNSRLLDTKVELCPEGKDLTLRVPIKANVSLKLPKSMISRLLNRETRLVQNVVSYLVEKEICPLLGYLIQNLGVEAMQNIIGRLQQGLQQTLKP